MSMNSTSVALVLMGFDLLSIGLWSAGGSSVARAEVISIEERGVDPNIFWFGVTSGQGGGLSMPERHQCRISG